MRRAGRIHTGDPRPHHAHQRKEHVHEQRASQKQKAHKARLVFVSDALGRPRTVVVDLLDAVVALLAMVRVGGLSRDHHALRALQVTVSTA